MAASLASKCSSWAVRAGQCASSSSLQPAVRGTRAPSSQAPATLRHHLKVAMLKSGSCCKALSSDFFRGVRLARNSSSCRAPAQRLPAISAVVAVETEQAVQVEERYRLDNLGPQKGSNHRAKRKGRGIAAGQGASCGFGMRGQKSRSGPGVRPGFEGGQTPLYRRLPKLRGIAGGMGAGLPKYVAMNLEDLFEKGAVEGEEITLESLKAKRLVKPTGRDRRLLLKVLGDGEVPVKCTVRAGSFSASARAKLEAAGCTVIVEGHKKKWTKKEYFREKKAAAAAAAAASK
ncbi:hypothetical protein CBR_g6324 [Chara braunii]|uniref:Large ribosomal subunit protein uL15/eL18 domain-containing protein n=1 Tax=Chara braunii TaxID=69332 RepID=A0A388KJP8_CHABU|nr:hypothetical protein CBR_g6324 [Chara braunii]|eukprot:GBG70193.1 hypothetical protein CBR_g6324 [Chara braunii]